MVNLRGSGGRFAKNPAKGGTFFDTLTPGIGLYAAALTPAVTQVMRDFIDEIENYAKSNAVWEDRTGDARDGLTASVEEDPVAPKLYLYHTVSYGVWLEVRFNGKYAIIMPTIEAKGPELMHRIGALL